MRTVQTLDKRIAADTFPVLVTAHSHIRLMNDSRWPWLMVLPVNSDAQELHHLDDDQRTAYLDDINQVSFIVQQHTRCRSVNIAMLGNVVSALHCHVVARNEGDPNWPAPIWGFENAVPYNNNTPDALINAVKIQLSENAPR